MDIVTRVKDMVLAPKATWPAIAGEQTDTVSLYTQYVMILAAIPAVAGFIGMSIFGFGFGFGGVTMRVPFMSGLVQMVLGYGMSLAMVYVLALIADFLAPKFDGQQNQMSALKMIAYSSTAAMVGGIFSLIPALGVLGIVASLYSLYTLYLGVPTMMKVPQEKAFPYTAVLVVCAIVVVGIMMAVLGAVRGGPTMGMSGMSGPGGAVSIETPRGTMNVEQAPGGGTVKMQTPDGAVTIDIAKAQAWGKRMEEASKKMQAAQQSGNQAEMEQAMKEMTALQAEQPMVKQ